MLDGSEADAEGRLGRPDFGESDLAVDGFYSLEVGLIPQIELAAVSSFALLQRSLGSSHVVVGLEVDVQVLLVLLNLLDLHIELLYLFGDQLVAPVFVTGLGGGFYGAGCPLGFGLAVGVTVFGAANVVFLL